VTCGGIVNHPRNAGLVETGDQKVPNLILRGYRMRASRLPFLQASSGLPADGRKIANVAIDESFAYKEYAFFTGPMHY
jgi:hypothetical protein